MNEKKRAWLIKVFKEFMTDFPLDAFQEEDNVEKIMARANSYVEIARNDKRTVLRWVMMILELYEDCWRILSGSGQKTTREALKEQNMKVLKTKEALNELSNICER